MKNVHLNRVADLWNKLPAISINVTTVDMFMNKIFSGCELYLVYTCTFGKPMGSLFAYHHNLFWDDILVKSNI